MSTIELKSQFHQLIDQIDDDVFLQNALNIIKINNKFTGQIPILNQKQNEELNIALKQVKQGKVVDNKIVKEKLQKKIDLCHSK